MKLKHLQRSFHQLVAPPTAVNILVANPLLFGLDEEVVMEFVRSGELKMFQPGDVLQEHNDEDTSLFIIIEGLVKVSFLFSTCFGVR